jgi:hypothetical protein
MPTLLTFPPGRNEIYTTPTWISYHLQRDAPGLYNPPLEVFQERFSGYDGVSSTGLGAIVGPDCHTVAYRADVAGSWMVSNNYCNRILQPDNLRTALVERHGNPGTDWRLVRLDPEDLQRAIMKFPVNKVITPSTGMLLREFLGNGWSGLESWGVWSEARRATMVLPLDSETLPATLTMDLTSFHAANSDPLKVEISIEGGDRKELLFVPEQPQQSVRLELRREDQVDGTITVQFDIDNPRSPASLGISIDERKLGIGLTRFMVEGR